jgi:UDPglucose 6-dehydrogenase
MREAPSLTIIQALVDAGAVVRAYDPQGMEAAKLLLPPIEYAQDAYGAADGADCIVIVTEWSEFRSLDFCRLKSIVKTPVVVDLRNICEPAELARLGFDYECIGRQTGKDGPEPEAQVIRLSA